VAPATAARDPRGAGQYYHGDTGRGVGASHQTGWTALAGRQISLATSPERRVVCLRNGDQSREDASRRALPLRPTTEGVLMAGALLIVLGDPCHSPRL
jgi:hypothetical protein